tara:strand:+ start:523 stop:1689 length:1167 start_codon:yes stop_codon:yes gene_type:complete
MGLQLVAKLGLDGKAFDTGLSRARQKTRAFGGAIKGQLAAAFGTAAIVGMTKKAVDYADTVNDMARKTGVTTDKIQEMAFAAAQSGSSLENVGKAFTKIQDAQGKAMIGTLGQVEAFQRLGFSMDDVSNMDAVEIFEQLGSKFSQVAPSAQELSDILLIMGKSGKENFRMLTEGLSDMQKQAHEAGAVMDQETIQQIADMKDEFAAFMQTMMPVFAKFATFVMDAAENVVHGLTAMWESFSQGLKAAAEEASKVWGMFKEGDILGAGAQIGKSIYAGMDKSADVLVDHTNQYIDRQSGKEARRRAKAEAAHRQTVGLQQFERLETLLENQEGKTKATKTATVDQMAKMGLFIGGRQDPILKKADKQIAEILKTNQHLVSINNQISHRL